MLAQCRTLESISGIFQQAGPRILDKSGMLKVMLGGSDQLQQFTMTSAPLPFVSYISPSKMCVGGYLMSEVLRRSLKHLLACSNPTKSPLRDTTGSGRVVVKR